MANAKIKAMMETLKGMEEMQKRVNNEINKDINAKRKDALKKIREYLDEIAESLDGRSLNIPLKHQLFGCCDSGLGIRFNEKYTKWRSTCGLDRDEHSKEKIPWWIGHYHSSKKSNNEYYDFIDGENDTTRSSNPGYWSPGFIELIENWNEIKAEIEKGLEQRLTKQMENIRKETEERITSYEKVNDFTA